MRNYFTSQGLLDDGMQMAGLSRIGRYDAETDPLRTFQEFVPRDENELVSMQRTMIPTGNQSKDGKPTFITPEGAQYQQNIALMQDVQTKAVSDFQKKVQNPFFKITDFAADAIRNTIGMPGGGLKADPSATAKSELQMKLQGLDMAAQQNATNLITAREARDAALKNVFKDPQNAFDIQAPSAKDFTPDSLAAYQKSGNAGDLVRRDDMITTKLGGVDYIYNKNDPKKSLRPVIPFEERAKNEREARENKVSLVKEEQYAKDRLKFINNLNKNRQSLEAADIKKQSLANNIKQVISILDANPGAAGFGSLLRNLPTSDAQRVAALLDTIRANVAFNALQEMRANSPTGGALGNVSNVELQLLHESLNPLNQAMTADSLRDSLGKIEETNNKTLDVMKAAYNKDIERYKSETYEDMIKNTDFNDYVFDVNLFGADTMQSVTDADAQTDANNAASMQNDLSNLFGSDKKD